MTTVAKQDEQSVPVTNITKAKKGAPAKNKNNPALEEVEKQIQNLDTMFKQFFPHHWIPTSPWSFSNWAKYSPFDLKSPDEFFNKNWLDPEQWGMPGLEPFNAFDMKIPKVDVIDRDEEILVRADMPGVKKEDLDVSVSEGSLSLKGNTSEEKEEDQGDYHRRETLQGSFSRTITLPENMDINKIRAEFKNGVLEVIIPKKEGAKRRSVKVE